MALRRFTLEAAGGFRGKDAGEAFARGLIGCFGALEGEAPEGLRFDHRFPVVDQGKRGERAVSAYWEPRRVLVDVVDRDAVLDAAWSELLRACLQLDAEPQYVVLTNQRDVRLYDLARDRGAPRLSVALDELPKYSEAFPFFEPDWVPGTTPKIINVDKVSKEVADLVAKVYRALAESNPGRAEDVTRFTLQCIVAMFSEDIGLLPKEYFTTLLYRAAEEGAAEEGGAAEKLAELFRQMATEGDDSGVPYFNGGLFTDPVTLELGESPLRALTKASEANWTFVDPHIFGSVFQGIMDDDERHASGAHYTAREDIMSVVGPTIVEPWRERISAASTLSELQELLKDLSRFKVLDPACGSGNFLYVAFRELYKLETEVLCRAYEFASVKKGGKVSWTSGIRTTSFFGLDINPFAVELAKTTLNIAKKIAHEERKATVMELFEQNLLETDPSLPLDNLDENIVCADALFTEWPEVDAIVGNPPFLGMQKIREELGPDHLERLKDAFPTGGIVDLCAYWFRRAHDHLGPSGRAGLIATSGIRMGRAREVSLEYVVARGGAITDAVSSRLWPGEAALNVSIVNWIRGSVDHARLTIDGKTHRLDVVHPHLQLHADLSNAVGLESNRAGTIRGIMFGHSAFVVDDPVRSAVAADGCLRPIATGTDLLTGKCEANPDYCIWLHGSSDDSDAQRRSEAGATHLREFVKSHIEKKANDPKRPKHYQRWLERWWEPLDPRYDLVDDMASKSRIVVCSSPQSRPVFLFASTELVPTNTLQVFLYEDDYAFGVIQSSLHWAWTKAKGGRVRSDYRYTSKVWKSFPWPQEPTEADVAAVGQAAQALRATRRRLMDENGWSLRDLYRSAEVEGPHPLKDAQAALDAAVEAAYGKPADQEATEFLLELNLILAEDEAAGETIQGPGLPAGLDPKDPRWFSTDCIEPPPLPEPDDKAWQGFALGETVAAEFDGTEFVGEVVDPGHYEEPLEPGCVRVYFPADDSWVDMAPDALSRREERARA